MFAGREGGALPETEETDGADAKPGTERETGETDRRGPDTLTLGPVPGPCFALLLDLEVSRRT